VRLSGRAFVVLISLAGLAIVASTDQIVPASSEYAAQMRLWLAARATGIVTYLLLTALVTLGLVLSHPVNQSTWKLSKRLFPWHEHLFMFTVAFLVVHVVSLVLDPYAEVGIGGALIPGLSSYRSAPVAVGVLALYALVLTGLTARYMRLIPKAGWLKIHRVSIATFVLAWIHGITTGTDYELLRPLYVITGLAVLAAAAYRYWVSRQRRPTFSARRGTEGERPPGATAPATDPARPEEATS
jgi:hypothetical protein